MQCKTKKRGVHFDPVIISKVINLSKTIQKHSDIKHSETTDRKGLVRWLSDMNAYSADSENEDYRAYQAAKNDFVEYLSDLPLATVKDILALMYLGRNGCFDGICHVPVHKRLSIYANSHCFRDNEKSKMIKHMAGKSKLLDKYLEDGLRFINEPIGKRHLGADSL